MTDAALKLDASPAAPAIRLWGGRFAAGPSTEMDRLNRSLPVDHRLWREDIAGSQAWASAIAAAGVLSHAEWLALQAGLRRVAVRPGEGGGGAGEGGPRNGIQSLVGRLAG